ncbi:MAG: hypothetical protein NC311_04315 [Muribaculaceae bacterium]|nr:hypothetical protein [Muribaculaceae bacterium]
MPRTPTKPLKMTKAQLRFRELLPHDGFCSLEPKDFKEMMKLIHNESDKMQKHLMFSQVLDKMFACGWGWYGRLGQSLSAMQTIRYASELSDAKRLAGLEVLRMVKNMHIELRYSPSYIGIINAYIRDFGGNANSMTRAVAKQQRAQKFNRATAALDAGQKVPRKLKKMIKSKLENTK